MTHLYTWHDIAWHATARDDQSVTIRQALYYATAQLLSGHVSRSACESPYRVHDLSAFSWSLKSSSLWIAENTDIPSRNATRCRLRTTCELLWGRLRWGCWRDRRCTTKLHEMRQHSCPTKYHDRRRRLWTACLALWDLLDHSEYHLNRITYGQTNK